MSYKCSMNVYNGDTWQVLRWTQSTIPTEAEMVSTACLDMGTDFLIYESLSVLPSEEIIDFAPADQSHQPGPND